MIEKSQRKWALGKLRDMRKALTRAQEALKAAQELGLDEVPILKRKRQQLEWKLGLAQQWVSERVEELQNGVKK